MPVAAGSSVFEPDSERCRYRSSQLVSTTSICPARQALAGCGLRELQLLAGRSCFHPALTAMKLNARPRTSCAAKALDYRKQSLPVERLGQKGRGPVLDGFLRSIVERGEHHHRDIGECPILALLGTELPAIHHRHHEVEQDQSWQAFGVTHQFKRLAAICGALHFVPQPREHFRKCFALAEFILNDENLRIHKSNGTGTATTCEFSGRTGL